MQKTLAAQNVRIWAMPIVMPKELAALVKSKSYALGDLRLAQTVFDRIVQQNRQRLELAQSRRDAIALKIQDLDEQIHKLAPEIDVSDIKPTAKKRNGYRKRQWGRYGQSRKFTMHALRSAEGEITTDEILDQTARALELNLVTKDDHHRHRERILRILNLWVQKGMVTRLHPVYVPMPGESHGPFNGRWAWNGPSEAGNDQASARPLSAGDVPANISSNPPKVRSDKEQG